MWFGTFFIRALVLSLAVAIYWLPVLVIVGYAITMVAEFFWDEPIALLMLFVLFVQPVLILLSILAIRAGMMVLKVTSGSDIGKLFSVTFKVLRFNIPLMWAITSLFGLAITLTGLKFLNPDYITDVIAAKDVNTVFDVANLFETMGEFPLILFSGWALGFAISVAAMGVSVAGASAMAAARPPNHHAIWGIGAQFINLLVLGLVVMVAPAVIVTLIAGGVDATANDLISMGMPWLYSLGIYGLWAICAMSAGLSLAYALAVQHEKEEREERMAAVAGMAKDRPKVDLAALRKSRMHNHDD